MYNNKIYKLEKEINKLKKLIVKLVEKKDYNFADKEVQKISQFLDGKINEYLKLKSNCSYN